MFLTQNYLVVDYEMGIFKMAPAVQGPLDENRANLVPICSQRGDSVNGTDTSKPDPTAKTNVGAIAGGVVGGRCVVVGRHGSAHLLVESTGWRRPALVTAPENVS